MNIELAVSLPMILLSIPIFTTFIVYYISKKIFQHRWKAIHLSVELTAIFYIVAVAIFLQKHFHDQFIGWILIVLIVILACILIFQWKRHTEVVLRKGLKVLARISFLLFGLLYILFLLYELVYFVYIHYFV